MKQWGSHHNLGIEFVEILGILSSQETLHENDLCGPLSDNPRHIQPIAYPMKILLNPHY